MALFKRKDKENKKGSENAIGKIIYGFLLFMPLLSIGARCLYVIFNKNAYQSYSEQTVTEIVTIYDKNELVNGQTYTLLYENRNGNDTTPKIAYTETNADLSISLSMTHEYYAIQCYDQYIMGFYYVNGVSTIEYGRTYNKPLLTISGSYFTLELSETGNIASTQNCVWQKAMYTTDKLDNVFEYSIDQTQESNLYNWAKETGTYTVLHNTTTGLGITNEFIPMLMAYWLIVSVIYFIFDIALILIWLVHNKIHELQESV